MLEAPRRIVLQLLADLTTATAADLDNEAIMGFEQRLLALAAEIGTRYFLHGPNAVKAGQEHGARVMGTGAAVPSPACGRRWPDEVGSDEGTSRSGLEWGPSGDSPHPSPLRGDTFSRKREKGEARP